MLMEKKQSVLRNRQKNVKLKSSSRFQPCWPLIKNLLPLPTNPAPLVLLLGVCNMYDYHMCMIIMHNVYTLTL